MKTILNQFFNQKKSTNNHSTAINNLLLWINENPILLLWGIWTSYLFLDISALLLLGKSIESYPKVIINYIGGRVINQLWFFVVLPNIIFERKWKIEIGVLLFSIGLFLCAKLAIDFLKFSVFPDFKIFLIFEILRFLQFFVFTTALWGFNVFANSQKEKYELEVYMERLKIEHRTLQLSPHFVLNMISQYSVAILDISKDLFKDLSKFTEILGYSYKSLERTNYLAQEISALEAYADCQRQRFGSKLQFQTSIKIGALPLDKFPLPKWTLMTLIENMFKHGNCFDKTLPCLASLRLREETPYPKIFTCSLTNPINISRKVPSTEFGVSSVKKILDYYFQENFKLYISETTQEFNLFLIITYYENFTNRTNR